MATSKKVTKHLEKKRIKFEVVPHKKVFTAYDLAQTLGEKLENIAKSLLVKVEIPEVKKKGGHYYVVVVPASYNVDFKKLKKALKAKKAEIAPERVMKKLGIEPGATSPFGSMRDLGVVVDKGLLKVKKAIVGAESFTESVRIKVKDLVDSEESLVAVIGKKNTLKLQKQGGKKKRKKRPAKKSGAKKKTAGRKPAKRKPATKKRKR
jgi:prolyl-tRNA editing enzyme YbaK/EbsC (Cys-tRNA(Pro) deacylase)